MNHIQLPSSTFSTKEYKGRTDSNSPTGPNEAVCLATLLLLLLLQYYIDCIYFLIIIITSVTLISITIINELLNYGY